MKRSNFKRAMYQRPPMAAHRPLARQPALFVVPAVATPAPKQNAVVSEPYRRLVAALACINCERPGPSQCAHADEGKGMGIKSDDRTCYPACATELGRVGCHDLIGASGIYTREERRATEQLYGAITRAQILRSGQWPASVPLFQDHKDDHQ